MKSIIVDRFEFQIPDGIEHCEFSEPDISGLVLQIEGRHYEVVNNRHMGMRLLISDIKDPCGFRDVPFNDQTLHMIPSITVKNVD